MVGPTAYLKLPISYVILGPSGKMRTECLFFHMSLTAHAHALYLRQLLHMAMCGSVSELNLFFSACSARGRGPVGQVPLCPVSRYCCYFSSRHPRLSYFPVSTTPMVLPCFGLFCKFTYPYKGRQRRNFIVDQRSPLMQLGFVLAVTVLWLFPKCTNAVCPPLLSSQCPGEIVNWRGSVLTLFFPLSD